eukprot:Sspe_Gene.114382::Locus_99934_Transcript_1_1_Confidence_1.000_Length_970::g.114382::m.114382
MGVPRARRHPSDERVGIDASLVVPTTGKRPCPGDIYERLHPNADTLRSWAACRTPSPPPECRGLRERLEELAHTEVPSPEGKAVLTRTFTEATTNPSGCFQGAVGKRCSESPRRRGVFYPVVEDHDIANLRRTCAARRAAKLAAWEDEILDEQHRREEQRQRYLETQQGRQALTPWGYRAGKKRVDMPPTGDSCAVRIKGHTRHFEGKTGNGFLPLGLSPVEKVVRLHRRPAPAPLAEKITQAAPPPLEPNGPRYFLKRSDLNPRPSAHLTFPRPASAVPE